MLSNLLKFFGIGKGAANLSLSDAESLRTAFQARYHNFKLLLSSNNKALQIMSELEEALRGNRPFGMSFVKANCTAVSVNVFRIVKHLDQLAPGKYQDLYERFRDIQESITGVLSQRKEAGSAALVVPFDKVDKNRADEVGNKIANLGEIRNRLGMKVPNGFVISSAAYRKFMEANDLQTEIDRLLQSTPSEELDQLFSLSAEIQRRITLAPIPEELAHEIMDAYAGLERLDGTGVKVSLRSSALGEDSADTSFAGQYRSELNVSPENILQAYREIVASKYSLQAITYRLNKGILDEDIDMCVGCMSMAGGTAGGVIYSRNPLDIRDSRIFIHSVWGLPKSVVDGSAATDLFIVAGGEPPVLAQKDVPQKNQKFVCYPDEGVCRMEILGSESGLPSISDEQAIELARMAARLEDYYGIPLDIEWTVDSAGTIFLLQCRPLKQTAAPARAPRRAGESSDPATLLEGGVTASPGAGCGPVFVVKKESDVLLLPMGAVMVVRQALPRWAALLGRVCAVVAEQGSPAGHLANVAREFGIPALFGLAGAAGLENGRTVTVDADGLRVHAGRVEALLSTAAPREALMQGTPVFDVLQKAAGHVVPLTLLDPDSGEFKPQNCRTLHDITRFCHEKSVKEMFNFGIDHHFSERASKQLVCGIPMQWWVLNLDDGFREDVPGKFVHLENIVSIPMLSLWEGIVAVPWEGPPPVDSKGFMSILMEASVNPALDPSMPSAFANKNYFMISKNFCSLTSRFGFHFSTTETLVSERAGENYIRFTFKGGAADYARKLRRARFVAGILEEFEFRVQMKEDGVFARLEGFELDVMEEKLRVLGYLLIHTRQLDMVMFNDSSCQQHKFKLLADIASEILKPGKSVNGINPV